MWSATACRRFVTASPCLNKAMAGHRTPNVYRRRPPKPLNTPKPAIDKTPPALAGGPSISKLLNLADGTRHHPLQPVGSSILSYGDSSQT